MAFQILKIDNSKDAAVKSGTWSNPGAAFYDTILNSMYSKDGTVPDDTKEYEKRLKSGSIGQYDTILKEAYLIAPVSEIHNSPHGRTPYSQSGCKYPHHVIRNGTLVVSIPGLKAAYSRAKQQGIFKGVVKEHLERHYRELGLYEDSTMTESVEGIPDTLYFGSEQKLDSLHGPIFLTPKPGIASLFLINGKKLVREKLEEELHQSIQSWSINVGYQEWGWDLDQLNQPLEEVHIQHNLPKLSKVYEGETTGYLYSVDVRAIKDHLTPFVSKDPDREVRYTGTEELPILEVTKHTIHWTMEYSPDHSKTHGEGSYQSAPMKDSAIYLDDDIMRDAAREIFGNSLSPQEMDQFLQHMKDYPDIRNLYHCEITDDDWEAIQSKMRKVARKQHLIESKLEENFQSIVSYLEKADPKLKELTDKEKEELAKADPDSYQNNNEDLVPIFGILKSYSMSKFRSDGTPKPDSEISSIKFKKFVKLITRGDNYSHALISFDSSLKEMYSFDSPGIVVDGIDDVESWKGTDSIYICVMFIPRADKMRMKRLVNLMIKHKDDTVYGFGNMIRAYISKPIKQPYQYICSSFVGFLMACSNPKNLHRDYSRFRPEDISILPRAFYVTNVTDYYDLKKRQPEIDARVNKIFTDHKEEIMEYNNELPKLFLKEKMGKLKSWDRLFDAIVKSFRD